MRKRVIKIKPNKNPFESLGVNNVIIDDISICTREHKVFLSCSLTNAKHIDEIKLVKNGFIKKFGDSVNFDFDLTIINQNFSIDDVKLLTGSIIEDIKSVKGIAKSFLYFYDTEILDNYIIIKIDDQVAYDNLINAGIDIEIRKRLTRFGIPHELKLVKGDFKAESLKLTKKQEDIVKKSFEEIQIVEKPKTPEPVKDALSTDIIYGRDIKDSPISFEEFNHLHSNETCSLIGQIFKLDKKITSTNKQLFIFNLTNFKDSLTIKFFAKEKEDVPIKNGLWVKIKGKKQVDSFKNNEEIIFATSVNKIDPIIKNRDDNHKEKRVELHAHTKMSDMDSVADVKELVSTAGRWGHKAIAITDHGVAHAFPAAYKAAKAFDDFKVIFGTEGYLVDDEVKMVHHPKDIPLEEETYIVFDLETTGFDPYKEEIIEIGAVKLAGTKIVDRFSSFVNPNKVIPTKITELTSITDEMVKDAPLISEILPKFLEFCGDATLVAHNANFDIGFINQNCERLNILFNPPIIDTLLWSRNIRKDKGRHGLKSIAKDYGISLDNHHRAVDDAEATAQIFQKFVNNIIREGAYKLTDVDRIFKNDIKNASTYHVIILAKNREGLKHLYELISRAHIDYFHRRPRIPKSLLRELRDGLIIGSACEAGEIIQGYLRGLPKSEIESRAEFYDYLEVQPHSNNSFLIDNGTLKSTNDLDEMNKYIYNLGKKLNKMTVATGDVHYINPEDNIYRSILLYGKGFNDFDKDSGLYFKTTDEMLKEFAYLGEDIAKEIVIDNPNIIAEMVEKLQPVPSGFYPPKLDNAEKIVEEMTYEKAYKIYGNPLPEHIQARIDRELKAIIGNGFSVLYLSAQKLVKESLDNGYLVGSRGSVGSSIVAFMMDITEVNALYPHYICHECKYNEFMDKEGSGVDLPPKDCPDCGTPLNRDGHSIPFEVFMGFNGDKVPDIDLNFSGEYQSEIHRYTERLFGKENVFKAGTISTLAEKNAYGYVKKYAEETENFLRTAEMERLAKGCENVKKTTGQHPGGMIIVPQGHSIYEFCPVQKPANDQKSDSIITHYDYHVMDEQLVKLDILGHDDPTTIKLLQEYTGIDIYDVPLADPKTLEIFSGTEAIGVTQEEIGSKVGSYGVPEFGTQFVRQMLVDTMPTTFAELVRISGLSHGTDVWLNNAQEFVKQGKATLSEVISVRDDIMNFLIDRGIEKGTAFKIMEFVRKGRPSREAEQWEEYSKLMKKHTVPDWYIESCRRIKYMFPKGHAVAYVMMAMRIAYFKVHHPTAFYAAYLSRKADDFNSDLMLKPAHEINEHRKELAKTGKLDVRQKAELALCEIIVEMNARGISFEGVDIYKSEGFRFKIEGENKIRVPLVAINGLGASVVENITKERELNSFLSYEDLKRRTKLSQTTIDKLKEINAIDGLSDKNQQALF